MADVTVQPRQASRRHRAPDALGLFGILALLAGLAAAPPGSPPPDRRMIDVLLTSGTGPLADPLGGGTALIMGPSGIPKPSPTYVDTVERVYLDPNGFTGQAISLYTPEQSCNCTDTVLAEDAADLVKAVNTQMATGDVSAANPIVVFGYSQSTAAAALAAEQLHDQAVPVPADDLHFVLVGDSASADGGMLNAMLPSLPSWMVNDFVKPLLPYFDLSKSMGLTTPDYYPTDVYTIPGDGYADWPSNFFANPLADLKAFLGLFIDHEQYLGLTPADIENATLTGTDGLVDYYTIPDSEIATIPTLLDAAVGAGVIPPADAGVVLGLADLLSVTGLLPLEELI